MSEIALDSVGVNPAWRKAVVHAAFGVSWPEGTSSQKKIQGMVAFVKQVESQLHESTPSSGAYFNEIHHDFFWHPSLLTRSLTNVQASLWEGDWKYTFLVTTTRH